MGMGVTETSYKGCKASATATEWDSVGDDNWQEAVCEVACVGSQFPPEKPRIVVVRPPVCPRDIDSWQSFLLPIMFHYLIDPLRHHYS